jgi:phosphatidylinositol 3-kinase
MTYILAIGDRHLDNILVTENGQLFHLDFGFVFGKDPKPYPSPFRLTREMAVGIGGENYQTSENFGRFKSYCYQAYNWLRKSSNLIMNLLSLMDERGIICDDKPMAIPEVLAVVEERLMLDLTDEEAETHFSALIEGAINALAPKIVEVMHIIRMKMK